jgi:hypothetical protein
MTVEAAPSPDIIGIQKVAGWVDGRFVVHGVGPPHIFMAKCALGVWATQLLVGMVRCRFCDVRLPHRFDTLGQRLTLRVRATRHPAVSFKRTGANQSFFLPIPLRDAENPHAPDSILHAPMRAELKPGYPRPIRAVDVIAGNKETFSTNIW